MKDSNNTKHIYGLWTNLGLKILKISSTRNEQVLQPHRLSENIYLFYKTNYN